MIDTPERCIFCAGGPWSSWIGLITCDRAELPTCVLCVADLDADRFTEVTDRALRVVERARQGLPAEVIASMPWIPRGRDEEHSAIVATARTLTGERRYVLSGE